MLARTPEKAYDRRMKLRLWRFLALGGAVLAGFSMLAILYVLLNPEPVRLTDQQINERLGCGRSTSDFRATDIYCTYPDVYRQHVRRGVVIGTPLPVGTQTFYLTFVDGASKRTASLKGVKIDSNNGVLCSPGTCNTNPKTWKGSTDRDGNIKIDSAYIQLVMTAQVDGFKPVTLTPRAGQQVYVVPLVVAK